jgi:hypothetical protein
MSFTIAETLPKRRRSTEGMPCHPYQNRSYEYWHLLRHSFRAECSAVRHHCS